MPSFSIFISVIANLSHAEMHFAQAKTWSYIYFWFDDATTAELLVIFQYIVKNL